MRTAVGQTVGPAQANRGRLGHFIVTGSDPVAVERRAEQVLAGITVVVDSDAPARRTGSPAPGPGPEGEATHAP
ncbi:hypothetical protein [Streptomyces sp. NPDC048644]|uniref:hypothetical protein n=1 Tax=Streptomyces sp. NPDC048644 TaxID=3365582 RepID=UPI003722525E